MSVSAMTNCYPVTTQDANNPEVVKTLKNAYNYYQDAAANYAKVLTTSMGSCDLSFTRMIV